MNGSVEAINIVFDGPPHMTVGGFVEVETADGCSMRIGQWLERAGGQWALRIESVQIPSPDVINRPDEAARDDPNREASQPADSRPILPPDLTGPVELELAEAVEKLPGRKGLPGGSRYELKYDGYLH